MGKACIFEFFVNMDQVQATQLLLLLHQLQLQEKIIQLLQLEIQLMELELELNELEQPAKRVNGSCFGSVKDRI